MKKEIAVLLSSLLIASAVAGCSESKTSETTQEPDRTTTTTTTNETTTTEPDATTTEPTLNMTFPDPDAIRPLSTGDHALPSEVEELYYESFMEIEELPGTPLALISESDGKYLIVELGDAMCYSGNDCYHIVEVGNDSYGAYINRLEYLDVQVGFGVEDTILNMPSSFELSDEQINLYNDNAPADCGEAFMYIAENSTHSAYLTDNGDGSIFVVSIDDSGNSEVLTSYDYSTWG